MVEHSSDSETVLSFSRKLRGAVKHLIHRNEKHILLVKLWILQSACYWKVQQGSHSFVGVERWNLRIVSKRYFSTALSLDTQTNLSKRKQEAIEAIDKNQRTQEAEESTLPNNDGTE